MATEGLESRLRQLVIEESITLESLADGDKLKEIADSLEITPEAVLKSRDMLLWGSGEEMFSGTMFSPIRAAQTLHNLIIGPTHRGREKTIVHLLARIAPEEEWFAQTMYELSRYGSNLPEKMIMDIADRSPWDLLIGRKIDPSIRDLWHLLIPGEKLPASGKETIQELCKRTLAAGARGNPSVEKYLEEKLLREDGQVNVSGRPISRLMEKPREPWQDKITFDIHSYFYSLFFKTRFRDWMTRLVGAKNVNSEEEVERACTLEVVKKSDGSDKRIGDIAILVNGWFNLFSSTPAVFYLARHLNGPVILANSNPNGPNGYELRKLEELWGCPIPDLLHGKIWTIGEMELNIMAWPQASDLFLEHLAVIAGRFDELKSANPGMNNGLNSFRQAHTTVFGHSMGGPVAVAARVRLNRAGLSYFIDRLVAVNSPIYEGSVLADGIDSVQDIDKTNADPAGEKHGLVRAVNKMLDVWTTPAGHQSVRYFDPDTYTAMRELVGWDKSDIDFSYATQVGRWKWGTPADKSTPLFALFASLSTHEKDIDGLYKTDGMVTIKSARPDVVSPEKKGHLISWEDLDTFREIIEHI